MPQFYITFARKMPEFYTKIAQKYFFQNLRGHVPPLRPVSYAYGITGGAASGAR